MTIGEVVERLSTTYPGLSISKVRFLEEEGLISPERTPGGYRKFTQTDVGRIELILRLQKEHFLPLSVIREKLADYDRGKVPTELRSSMNQAGETATLPFEDTETVAVDDAPTSLGLPASFIDELVEFGLIEMLEGDDGSELSRDDVAVAHACWDLRRYGVEPRHLRMYETFAEREATLFSQILMPAFRHRTPETRQKLVETLSELTEHTGDLKSHLLRRALATSFEDLV
jgi:DNA-binding transcriptional MerR regulator